MTFPELQSDVASIAHKFAVGRPTRQLRRHLDQADCDQLRDAGLHRVGLPRSRGLVGGGMTILDYPERSLLTAQGWVSCF